MKNLFAMAVGTAALLSSGVLFAQNGTMMNGTGSGSGWMGGYSGMGCLRRDLDADPADCRGGRPCGVGRQSNQQEAVTEQNFGSPESEWN